jgi:hypothetical protein
MGIFMGFSARLFPNAVDGRTGPPVHCLPRAFRTKQEQTISRMAAGSQENITALDFLVLLLE